MSDEWKLGVVYVCPERDIECGSFERNWCANCPKRRATPPSPSTAPTVEVDERAAFSKALAASFPDMPARADSVAQTAKVVAFAMFQAGIAVGLASKPPAREAAERQSIADDEQFVLLMAEWAARREHFEDDENEHVKVALVTLIAHIDTWGGAEAAQPLAYIAPHVMESLRAGCHVATVLSPLPDEKATEVLYGR